MSELNYDVCGLIVNFLESRDLLSFSQVSKVCHEVAKPMIMKRRKFVERKSEVRWTIRHVESYYEIDGYKHGWHKVSTTYLDDPTVSVCNKLSLYKFGKLIRSQGIMRTAMSYTESEICDGDIHTARVSSDKVRRYVRYELVNHDGTTTLTFNFDNGQIWTWRYPEQYYNMALLGNLSQMPPYYPRGYVDEITSKNCSLVIKLKNMLLFTYSEYEEKHYRKGELSCKHIVIPFDCYVRVPWSEFNDVPFYRH
jgi:hypothetical protein